MLFACLVEVASSALFFFLCTRERKPGFPSGKREKTLHIPGASLLWVCILRWGGRPLAASSNQWRWGCMRRAWLDQVQNQETNQDEVVCDELGWTKSKTRKPINNDIHVFNLQIIYCHIVFSSFQDCIFLSYKKLNPIKRVHNWTFGPMKFDLRFLWNLTPDRLLLPYGSIMHHSATTISMHSLELFLTRPIDGIMDHNDLWEREDKVNSVAPVTCIKCMCPPKLWNKQINLPLFLCSLVQTIVN